MVGGIRGLVLSEVRKKMKLKNRIKNAYNAFSGKYIGTNDRGILDILGIDENTPQDALSQTTYYVCLKTMAEAIGKMPLKLYQYTDAGTIKPPMTDTLRLLALQPNPYMTATIFWSLMEFCCQHYGNAYAWIDGEFKKRGRYGGTYEIRGFYPMHPNNVRPLVDDIGIFGTAGCLYYEFTNPDTGEVNVFKDTEILHFKNWYTENGIVGKSVRENLRNTISGASAASEYENNLYKNGLSARMVMQYTGSYDDDKVKLMQKRFANMLTSPKNAGKIVPIPMEFGLQPLNMSMVDAEFSELRKYSARQIASAFGIKPSQINDYENSKYASSESEAIAFLVDTLLYRLKMYEEEINAKVLTPAEYKAGMYYKFNEKVLLRTDSKTQSEILKNYVQGGIYTPNEARDYLDKSHIDGGDTLLINGSYVPIEDAGKAYNKGGKT